MTSELVHVTLRDVIGPQARLLVAVSLVGFFAHAGCAGSATTAGDAGSAASDAMASSSGDDGSCPVTTKPIPCSGGDHLECTCDGSCVYVGLGYGGGCSSSSGSAGGGNSSGGSSGGGSDASDGGD